MNFRSEHRRRGIGSLEITPLVDVVFLLLIFFLLTATYVKNPNLDINLPKASINQVTSQRQDVTIAINGKGELRYDGQEVSIGKLEGILRAEYAEKEDTIVVINADKTAKHGRVVEVMDLAKKVGFGKLAIAVQSKRPGE
jgi:biopolymer transport protein ExbD